MENKMEDRWWSERHKETIYKFVKIFYFKRLCLLRNDDSEKGNERDDALCIMIDDIRLLMKLKFHPLD